MVISRSVRSKHTKTSAASNKGSQMCRKTKRLSPGYVTVNCHFYLKQWQFWATGSEKNVITAAPRIVSVRQFFQQLLLHGLGLAMFWCQAMILPVCIQLPGLRVVIQIHIQFAAYPLDVLHVINRESHLHTV